MYTGAANADVTVVVNVINNIMSHTTHFFTLMVASHLFPGKHS